MKARARSLTCLLLTVMACLAPIPGEASPTLGNAEPGFLESLAPGSVTITTKQIRTNSFLLALDLEVDGIVAAVVTTPSDVTPLLRVELKAYSPLVEETMGPRKAYALLTIEADELKGRMENLLSYDGRTLDSLVIYLVTHEGEIHPLTVRSQGFAEGQEHKIELRGTHCFTIEFSCTKQNGQSCSTSKECCSQRVDYCADCNGCTITCPPCSLLPD